MPRIKMGNSDPNPVDIYVGSRVKSRRLILGFSQEDLAKSIGLTFQQIQKYERGINRISVSRLVDICRALKTPIDYFLEGSFSVDSTGSRKLAVKGFSDTKQELFEADPMVKKDVMELVRAYSKIRRPQLKKQILEMAKALSNSSNDFKNS